jgi:hypothetical protein
MRIHHLEPLARDRVAPRIIRIENRIQAYVGSSSAVSLRGRQRYWEDRQWMDFIYFRLLNRGLSTCSLHLLQYLTMSKQGISCKSGRRDRAWDRDTLATLNSLWILEGYWDRVGQPVDLSRATIM